MGKHCIVNWCPDQNMPETQDLVHVFTTYIEHIMGSFSDQIDKCTYKLFLTKKLSKESKQYNYM